MADFKLGRIKFKWKGNWATNTDYVKDDIVKFNANSFVCVTNHTSSGTTDGWFLNDFANWETYVPGINPTGVYSSGTKYYVNDIATYNGSSYISLTNANVGNTPPTSTSAWTILAQGNPDMTTSNVYYVSNAGSNSNDGKTISTAFKTLRYACDNITGPASIYVKAGTYEETLPITVPAGVSIIGDGMRDTEIKPLMTKVATSTYVPTGSTGTTLKVVSTTGILVGMAVTGTNIGSNRTVATIVDSGTVTLNTAPSGTPTGTITFTQTNLSTDASPKANNLSTMFLLSNETMIHQLLMTGMTGFTPSLVTPSDITLATVGGVFCALNPASPVTTKSPYIKDCTAKSTGGIGALVDGSVQSSGYRSMVFWAYNQVHDDGVGIWVKDNGKTEAVSCFTYYAYFGYAATGGGKIRSLSGNNSYGTFGAVSRGYSSTETPVTGTIYGGMLTFNSAASTGIFQVNETITQATSGATGTVTSVQNGFLYYKSVSGSFNTTNLVTGGTSGATMTPSAVGGQSGYLLVLSGLTALPVAGASIEFATGDTAAYVIQSVSGAYVNSSSKITVTLAQQKSVASVDGVTVRIRYNFSQIRLTGHDFLSIGTGNTTQTNYPDIPLQSAVPSNETVNVFPGRVYYVTTDQDGNFRVGPYFAVNQATGSATLNASAFNLSGLTSLRLGTVGAQLGAQVDEFSTDGTMSQNSAVKVPTQSAVRTYLGAAYQNFSPVADTVVTTATASSGNNITVGTTTGVLVNMPVVFANNMGNIVAGTQYYILTASGNTITITATNNGVTPFSVGTTTGQTNPANIGFSLGESGKRWSHLYVGPGSITLGSITLTDQSGTLAVTASGNNAPANINAIQNGTSNVTVANNGNVTITGGGNLGLTIGSDGSASFAGSVTVNGGSTNLSTTNLNINDPLIYMAQSNPANLNDIGLVGHFTSGIYQHTGMVRQASTNTWMFFSGATTEPTTTIPTSDGTFVYDPIKSGTVTTTGSIRYQNSGGANTNYVAFQAPSSVASSVTWTLPSADASTAGFALVSNGSGTLSWAAAGAAITDDTSTTTLYPTMTTLTTGNFTAAKVSSTKMSFNASSGVLTTSGGFVESSSIALKENVMPIQNALDIILQLCGVTYDRRDGSRMNEPGLIAERVAEVADNLVSRDENGNPVGIYYSKLTAYLVEAVKKLNDEINSLKGL